ncbi:hypothetical protein MPSEU_001024600 [Mayamaea pseudoterrestris]|nr:hypothetical protein MPSEU_001024600 [Mayamaea pseudoterrestris]
MKKFRPTQQMCLLIVFATIFFRSCVSVKARGTTRKGSVFLSGDLGRVVDDSVVLHGRGLASSASTSLARILETHQGATGSEIFLPGAEINRVILDDTGHKHLRFQQIYDGYPVVDAAMVMHVDDSGEIYSVNGEFIAQNSVNTNQSYTCDEAFANVLLSNYGDQAVWLSDCDIKIVVDKNGDAHMAWERELGYQPVGSHYYADKMYASVVTGKIVAVRPQVMGALSLITKDCKHQSKLKDCQIMQSNTRASSDKAKYWAEKHARSTYKFYHDNFGRDSIDGNGTPIISNVHYANNYENGFFDGRTMSVAYGDGNGVNTTFFSRSIDIVAHELSHGYTYLTSRLLAIDESGALNEAISDIFAACVSRQEGATVGNSWLIGEGLSKTDKAGRYMADPTTFRNSTRDWYADRYMGSTDQGGVHKNSGIMSLAFVLMVQGGHHPRGKSTINVPAIDPDFDTSLLAAAKIIYFANTACLTPASGFHEARRCTVLFAGQYVASVEAAWDAVGVIAQETSLADIKTISNWVTLVDNDVVLDSFDMNDERFVYSLSGVIKPEQRVSCALSIGAEDHYSEIRIYYGNATGPAELSVLAGHSFNECSAIESGEVTSAFVEITQIAVYGSNNAVQIICGIEPPPIAVSKTFLLNGLSGETAGEFSLQVFKLDGVKQGEISTCTLTGGNGNADLYMRPDAVPYPLSRRDSMCASASLISNESCAIKAALSDTSVYVSIHAVASYSNLTLRCTTCKPRGVQCQEAAECCGATSTCDGPTKATRQCKKSIAAGGVCIRRTQCRRGQDCRNGRCIKS